MSKRIPDFYYSKAKDAGFAARSVFKLEELDHKYRLVKAGMSVLDLGASPGSWVQYLSDKVGPKGKVVALDLNPLEIALPSNVHFFQCSIEDEEIIDRLKPHQPFDLVVSDMAPRTSGNRDVDHIRSIELCRRGFFVGRRWMKPNADFLCKMFQGSESESFLKEVKPWFQTCKVQKPEASRKESREVFVLAKGLKKPIDEDVQ